jgi:hypothetical protein
MASVCLVPVTANSAMYKWVDENGITQYSQTPPVGIKTEKIGVATAPAEDPETLKNEQAKKMEAFEKRRQNEKKQQELAKKKQEEKARLKERCAKIQKNIDTLKYKNRVFDKKDGEVVTLTTEERQKQLKELRETLAKDCK